MISIDESMDKWSPFLCYATALDDYNHTNDQVLHLKRGESVVIIEKSKNWYRGYSLRSTQKFGIFPISLVHTSTTFMDTPIMDLNIENLSNFIEEQQLHKEITLEIQQVLKDWYDALMKLLLKSEYILMEKLLLKFYQLVDKKNVLSTSNTFNQQNMIKNQIMEIVQEGNSLISKDVHVWENGVVLKEHRFFKLYKAYCKRFNDRKETPVLPLKDLEKMQILVQFDGFIGVDLKEFQVQIGIWNGKNEALYQPFVLNSFGSIVFTDVTKSEIFKENLFLMIKVLNKDKGISSSLQNRCYKALWKGDGRVGKNITKL